MSVTTTADESRDEAKAHLKNAYLCLLVVLNEDTWGHSEYTDSYIKEMNKVALKLVKLHKKI